MKYRYEKFGGIISNEDPPLAAYVDQEFMRELGAEESDLWTQDGGNELRLSAPIEVHFALTNNCTVGCKHCFKAAEKDAVDMLSLEEIKRALKKLSEMGVFHVAFGGGEPLIRDDVFEIAEVARSCGLIPTLTTSGVKMTPEIAAKLSVFSRVNVSIDGVGKYYNVFRKVDMFEKADHALQLLLDNDVHAGINCIVGKDNFKGLKSLFEYAHQKGVHEIDFLRIKPSGRALDLYWDTKLTEAQNVKLLPTLGKLAKTYEINTKLDCSFMPMIACHNPDKEQLRKMLVFGCEAGNAILGVTDDGYVCGCSFFEGHGLSVFDLEDIQSDEKEISTLAGWMQRAPEPCKSCPYVEICKGGCHAISAVVEEDIDAPDPECPRVVEYKKRSA